VACLGATQAQADALAGDYLPHHSRPGLEPAPARRELRVVAYEGNTMYLGAWGPALAAACRARGWDFLVNPPDLRTADLVVAFRAGQWDGWACREWKSGVKIINALAAGRPCLTQWTAAAREIGAPGMAIETPAELGAALDACRPYAVRDAAAARCAELAPAYNIAAVVERYRRIIGHAMRDQCSTVA
jgi:hypothetical protein